ncbi:MAG: hypothetical protein A2X94_07685 [Bdellovibrionales bacterium GWB1_55_8]|nr:MAG: hypothetical protein A2X94_07685 [Bdellovibrionales bacterium GWB1_55_8]
MSPIALLLTCAVLLSGYSSGVNAQVLEAKVNLKGACESRADVGHTAYRILQLKRKEGQNSVSMGVSYLRCVRDGSRYRWQSIAADAKREEKAPDGRKITLWQTDVEIIAVDENQEIIARAPLKLDAMGRMDLPFSKSLRSLERAELMVRGHQYYQVQGEAAVSDGLSTTASYIVQFKTRGENRDCKPQNPVLSTASGIKGLPSGVLPEGVEGQETATGEQVGLVGDCPMISAASDTKSVTEAGGSKGARVKAGTTANKAAGE